MTRRSPLVPTLVVILLALAVAAVAAAAWRSEPKADPPQLSAASKLHLAQTQPNKALVKLPNAKPGQIAMGSTRLSVTGAPALITVRATNPRDIAGPRGGRLIRSGALRVAVSCTGHPCPGSGVAYMGPLNQMGIRSLGLWAAGTSRTYTVRVWMRNGGLPPSSTTGDNVFQGSTAKFGLVWTATAP